MRDLDRIVMNDAVDVYIRQGLKNWAARKQPPASGRARLLLKAASLASIFEQPQPREKINARFIHPALARSLSGQIVDPIGQTMVWSLQVTFMPMRLMAQFA